MQNFCGKCGTKLSSELKFCTNCGAPIQTNVEPSNKEIPIKIVAKEDTKAEKEVAAEKKSFDTQPYISKDQSFELKIKKISIRADGELRQRGRRQPREGGHLLHRRRSAHHLAARPGHDPRDGRGDRLSAKQHDSD